MDFELGGMQPLVRAMPEVMLVSSLLSARPEIQPLLAAMERESLTRQVGYAGILARLADVVAALIVRAWVECGCGNATGWVQVLRDPKLSRAIYAMHQQPGVNWKVEDLARESGLSRSVFAERFLTATGTTPARYLTELRMRWRYNTSAMKAKRWKKSPSASATTRSPPLAAPLNALPAKRRERYAMGSMNKR